VGQIGRGADDLLPLSLWRAQAVAQPVDKQRHHPPNVTRTNLNGCSGTETVEERAREAVRVALLGPDGPTGTLSNTAGPLPW